MMDVFVTPCGKNVLTLKRGSAAGEWECKIVVGCSWSWDLAIWKQTVEITINYIFILIKSTNLFFQPLFITQTSVPFVNMSGYCEIYCRSHAFFHFLTSPLSDFSWVQTYTVKCERTVCGAPRRSACCSAVCVCYSQWVSFLFSPFISHSFLFQPPHRIAHRPLLFKHKMLRAFLALPPSRTLSSSPTQRATGEQAALSDMQHSLHTHTYTRIYTLIFPLLP